jgi:glycerol-1-phosphate dehydrogenase [NAD(P)+]
MRFRLEPRSLTLCSRYFFGSRAIDKLAQFCREIRVQEKNAVLVCDGTTWKVAAERISVSLSASGFRVDRVIVEKGAVRSEVEKARERIRLLSPCIVFGIGGGVSMDIGKASAFLEKACWITVPTSFATDAMTGINATFRGESRGVDDKAHEGDYDIRVGPPLACVVDTDIVRNAPWKFQAAGYADYLAKLCATHDWGLAYSRGKDQTYSEYAIMLARAQVEYLMKNASRIRKDERAFEGFLQVMMNDGFLTEMAGNSRILFGSEHVVAQGLMEEQMRANVAGLHGEQVGLGTILMAYLQGQDWMAVKTALEQIGAPVTAEQIGLGDESVIRALTRARAINESWLRDRPDIYTIVMEKPLTRELAKGIAKGTGVIR